MNGLADFIAGLIALIASLLPTQAIEEPTPVSDQAVELGTSEQSENVDWIDVYFDPNTAVTMRRIRGCESMGDPNHPTGNANAQNLVSSAAGHFQVIRSTWEWSRERGNLPVQSFEQGRYDPEQNTIVASWLVYESGFGLTPWDESRGCWG